MTQNEDHEVLAAEYVLGTLDADERAQAQALIDIDSDFAGLVKRWERRIGELHLMVESVEPPDAVWERIRERIAPDVPLVTAANEPPVVDDPASADVVTPSVSVSPPASATPSSPSALEADLAAAVAGTSNVDTPKIAAPKATTPKVTTTKIDTSKIDASKPDSSNVVDLTRRIKRWRGVAIGMSALAATLALFVATTAIAPQFLPAPLRPGGTEFAGAQQGRFVAVLQRDAASPAFLLTVDITQKSLTVRRVAAEQQAGKSYELWLVSNRFPAPRSLGVVGSGEFTSQPTLAAYEPEVIRDATFAISLEPEGGSPTGFATGPVLFLGKLLEATPRS
jgi:anti-sigma-K factor RskA